MLFINILFHLVINIPIFSYKLIWTSFILTVISHILQKLISLTSLTFMGLTLFVFLNMYHFSCIKLNIYKLSLYFYISAYEGFSSNGENTSLHLFPVLCIMIAILSLMDLHMWWREGNVLISPFKIPHGIQKVMYLFHF